MNHFRSSIQTKAWNPAQESCPPKPQQGWRSVELCLPRLCHLQVIRIGGCLNDFFYQILIFNDLLGGWACGRGCGEAQASEIWRNDEVSFCTQPLLYFDINFLDMIWPHLFAAKTTTLTPTPILADVICEQPLKCRKATHPRDSLIEAQLPTLKAIGECFSYKVDRSRDN